MALEARLNELKMKHKEMEAQIVNEGKFAATDEAKVSGLKRQKMRLKEQISDIQTRIAN